MKLTKTDLFDEFPKFWLSGRAQSQKKLRLLNYYFCCPKIGPSALCARGQPTHIVKVFDIYSSVEKGVLGVKPTKPAVPKNFTIHFNKQKP